tara:strand:+ start:133 stop:459 length:327 start_codon:yes stop_codon:yes gene_type:complete
MSQLSRIMGFMAPKQTKRKKLKKTNTPTWVPRPPPIKPHAMSDMQWEAVNEQYRRWNRFYRGVEGGVEEKTFEAPSHLQRWTVSAAGRDYQRKVASACRIQRWWKNLD